MGALNAESSPRLPNIGCHPNAFSAVLVLSNRVALQEALDSLSGGLATLERGEVGRTPHDIAGYIGGDLLESFENAFFETMFATDRKHGQSEFVGVLWSEILDIPGHRSVELEASRERPGLREGSLHLGTICLSDLTVALDERIPERTDVLPLSPDSQQ